MKKRKTIFELIAVSAALVMISQTAFAQGYGGPMTFNGVDQFQVHSAASRALGGISVGLKADVGLMFQNPAALSAIRAMQISLAGQSTSTEMDQEQNYAPVRYFSNLSLLLEGLTDQIPDPDPTLVGFTAQDTVQRPYDNIGPNWSRSKTDQMPLQAMLAVPVSFEQVQLAVGMGTVQYADLNHYYQNNNILSPGILSQRPLPTARPADDNPLTVEWMRSLQSREGTIRGYGLALSGSLPEYKLSLGFSGLLLNGSSDDYQQQITRADLVFYANAFRADSAHRILTSKGTSDYSGAEFTVSGILGSAYVNIGFSFKLPTTITRSYTMEVTTDTTGTAEMTMIAGEDQLKLPFRGTVGLSLTPRENLLIGMEYEFRPYASTKYTDPSGKESSPWLSASLFRVGIQYMAAPWLALRGGMRGEAEVFEAEGNQISGDPVQYTVYSTGAGVFYSGLRLDVTYEYASIKYEDVWASAISKNSETQHRIVAQLSYGLPWAF